MHEEAHKELTQVCDEILLAPDSTVERVAIGWLHVLREHPFLLANYIDIFESAESLKVLILRWRRMLRQKPGVYWQILRSLRVSSMPWLGSEMLPSQIDVLFIPPLLNSSQLDEDDDFYLVA